MNTTRLLSIIALTCGLAATGAYAAEAAPDKAPKAEGTKADRKAARTAKRAELKDAAKKGELPKTTEAGAEPKK
jgi:hypothetical protein